MANLQLQFNACSLIYQRQYCYVIVFVCSEDRLDPTEMLTHKRAHLIQLGRCITTPAYTYITALEIANQMRLERGGRRSERRCRMSGSPWTWQYKYLLSHFHKCISTHYIIIYNVLYLLNTYNVYICCRCYTRTSYVIYGMCTLHGAPTIHVQHAQITALRTPFRSISIQITLTKAGVYAHVINSNRG